MRVSVELSDHGRFESIYNFIEFSAVDGPAIFVTRWNVGYYVNLLCPEKFLISNCLMLLNFPLQFHTFSLADSASSRVFVSHDRLDAGSLVEESVHQLNV